MIYLRHFIVCIKFNKMYMQSYIKAKNILQLSYLLINIKLLYMLPNKLFN